jgi:hypothetical protein
VRVGRDYPHVWTRRALPPNRQGQRCRKTGKRGAGNTVEVQFVDGRTFMVAEGGLEKADGR